MKCAKLRDVLVLISYLLGYHASVSKAKRAFVGHSSSEVLGIKLGAPTCKIMYCSSIDSLRTYFYIYLYFYLFIIHILCVL